MNIDKFSIEEMPLITFFENTLCVLQRTRGCTYYKLTSCVFGRELLSFYKFRGDDIPITRGSALCALEGRRPEIGRDAIMKLMKSVDEFIPLPKRALDKPFSMPIGTSCVDYVIAVHSCEKRVD